MKSVLFLGLALVVALPSSAKGHPALSMKVFTSPDDQFWVNSTIIEGAREVMLVDAFGSGATSHVVAISKYDADFIEFENSRIEILKKVQGDTDENTMLWFPEQRTLIAGDTVFNDMHVYTAETYSNARKNWSSTLKKIRELTPSVVIPGHSKVGAPLDATTALDFTERYLLVFEEELKKAKDPESLVKAMKDDFPSADLILALERGAKANVKH
jgi:glyoxylase-like metal-dependent hydrolase (beta-lactamase superfamily II)